VIAIDGAFGTLSELAFALVWQLPVIGLRTWEFSYPGFDPALIQRVDSAEDAVKLALEAAIERRAVDA
jgi:predicted Rossmann-fold nucleotide-binding protein